jgi:cytochrome c oxidase cbb3-type subunit 3
MRLSAAMLGLLPIAAGFALLTACSAEKRPSGPSQPQTPPNGPNDPRIAQFEDNSYQLSEGGRYFAWYGCSACHAQDARGARNLADKAWAYGGAFDQIYRSISGHGGLDFKPGQSIPAEQMWQLTAYVRSLSEIDAAKRRRQDLDQAGEPQAGNWLGPVE